MLLNIFNNDLEVNIKTADNIEKCCGGTGSYTEMLSVWL